MPPVVFMPGIPMGTGVEVTEMRLQESPVHGISQMTWVQGPM